MKDETTLQQEKRRLRREALSDRHEFASDAPRRKAEDKQIFSMFKRLPEDTGFAGWQRIRAVFLYASFGDEVPTWTMMAYLRRHGVPVCLPRVSGPHTMEFHVWNKEPLLKNRFGIREPSSDLPVDVPDQDCLVLVPGLRFDRSGYRLGYGGGYYDAYFSAHPDGVKAGLLYRRQLSLSDLPHTKDDQKLDYLVISLGILRCFE